MPSRPSPREARLGCKPCVYNRSSVLHIFWISSLSVLAFEQSLKDKRQKRADFFHILAQVCQVLSSKSQVLLAMHPELSNKPSPFDQLFVVPSLRYCADCQSPSELAEQSSSCHPSLAA